MTIGAAAATLLGLLFVSLSLNVDVITRKESDDLRALAIHTFGNFMSVLVAAVIFLIPGQVPLGLCLPLIGIGVYGLYNATSHLRKMRRTPRRVWRMGGISHLFGVPVFCFGTLTVVAAAVLLGWTGGLYWFVCVIILLIVAASRSAWDLLMGLRQAPPDA